MHSTRNANPISRNSPSALKVWTLAARPKTLIAGLSPVLIGASFAARTDSVSLTVFALCLLFSISLQIGTNFANDYFDYMKGADTASRKGPARAVQSGWIRPMTMRYAALALFGISILSSIPLLMRLGTSYIPLMLLCILAGIAYTGGKRPLGYLGLGDLLVFVFYGPVAVCCTALALLLYFPEKLLILSLAPGFLSCAILCINNLRDEIEDRKCGKMTLVARFGQTFGRTQYVCYLLGASVILFLAHGLLPSLLFAALAIKPTFIVLTKKQEELNPALGLTALLLTIYTLFSCLYDLVL